MKHTLFIIAILFLVQSSFAQDEIPPISTDRPDWTESALTVPKKTFQIESGFTFVWDKQDGVSSKDYGYNLSLFRYGLLNRLEIRLIGAFLGVEKDNDITGEKTSYSGLAPIVLGFKWTMLDGAGPIPTLGFLWHIDIPPAASEDFKNNNVKQNFILAGSWVLSDIFSFGFNFGTRVDWKDSDFTPLYTASLGISILPWMGGFVELYGFLPAGEYSDNRFDLGLTFPVRHNLQFDISTGMGLSKNSPDGFGSLGFAWRIPR